MIKWIHITFVLLGFISYGQKLTTTAFEQEILIGEPVMITYSVIAKPSAVIEFKPDSESIKGKELTQGVLSSKDYDFEILETFTDTTKLKNGDKEWIGRYTITVWDSGAFLLPGPQIVIDDSTFEFKNITIKATYSKSVKGVDIYDIKENFAEIPDEPFSILKFFESNWWWLLILILIFPIYFLIRRTKYEKISPPLFKAMSLKERTLMAIDALDNSKMWEKDQLKEHFVELSYILRSYLTARYNISILEKTTYETKLLLTQKGLNEDTIDTIVRILSESDLVKFAKSKPELISILRVSTLARQIVAETSPLEFDNVE